MTTEAICEVVYVLGFMAALGFFASPFESYENGSVVVIACASVWPLLLVAGPPIYLGYVTGRWVFRFEMEREVPENKEA